MIVVVRVLLVRGVGEDKIVGCFDWSPFEEGVDVLISDLRFGFEARAFEVYF